MYHAAGDAVNCGIADDSVSFRVICLDPEAGLEIASARYDTTWMTAPPYKATPLPQSESGRRFPTPRSRPGSNLAPARREPLSNPSDIPQTS